jgi:hypothetical protein
MGLVFGDVNQSMIIVFVHRSVAAAAAAADIDADAAGQSSPQPYVVRSKSTCVLSDGRTQCTYAVCAVRHINSS